MEKLSLELFILAQDQIDDVTHYITRQRKTIKNIIYKNLKYRAKNIITF